MKTPPTIRFPALARRLKRRRCGRRLTRTALARKANVCFATVRDLEEGRRGDPRTFTVWKLADALDTTLMHLLGQDSYLDPFGPDNE
jgi:transcriptional regulator with XRE-family HTH domain